MSDQMTKELEIFAEAMLDVDRLKIVGELVKGNGSISALAERMNMHPKHVLAHLEKLSRTGVVSLEESGDDHTYILNSDALENMARRQFTHARELQVEEPDLRVIGDRFTSEEIEVIQKYVYRNGTLKKLPSIYKTDIVKVIHRYLLQFVDPEARYTELEINKLFKPYTRDFASVRRDLVDFGYMDRLPDGSAYWLTDLGREVRYD